MSHNTRKAKYPGKITWNHYSPVSVHSSDSSLASSSLLMLQQSPDSGEYNDNSSGWPSLINIASTVSLLSSYTPKPLHQPALSPIEDIDESCMSRQSSEIMINSLNVFREDDLFGPSQKPFGEPRSKIGPMDVDYDDGEDDSAWLSPSMVTPTRKTVGGFEHSRKRRWIAEQQQQQQQPQSPLEASTGGLALGNTPFTFSMPPPEESVVEPMAIDTEAVRDTDHQPISPNAARRIYSRRQQQQQQQQQKTPEKQTGNARHHQALSDSKKRYARRRCGVGAIAQEREDMADDAWITDSESVSDHASTTSKTNKLQVRRRGKNQHKRAGNSRKTIDRAVTQAVDRVLAMLGTRVDEPTMVERLQMHRDIPYVLSGYLQLVFNIFMVGTVLLLVTQMLMTIKRDIDSKAQEHSVLIMQNIADCEKSYRINQCAPELRVPHMERDCMEWQRCIDQDPKTLGRARVTAETLAEILNGFIEPISLKTMLFFVLMFFGTLFLSNFAFGAYRHSRVKQQYDNQSAPTPARSASRSRRQRRRQSVDDYLARSSRHDNQQLLIENH